MLLGMPTLIELDSLEENIHLCHELDLDFIELNMDLPYCSFKQMDIGKIKGLLDEYGLFLTMHFPEQADLGNYNEIIRESYLKLFQSFLPYIKQLKIQKINLHFNEGIYFTLPNKKEYIYQKDIENFRNNWICSLKEFINQGLTICIENTQTPDFKVNEIEHLLSELPQLMLTWDIGHDKRFENKVEHVYVKNQQRIKHFHLHDVIGQQDHLEFGKGEIDFSKYLRYMNEESTIVIEVKTKEGLTNSVIAFREFLQANISSRQLDK